ncbi:MAG: ribosome maturation factor RimP, partial [Lachnospiraceae bacterium]|nr:ribosome maturation factor RimP [Lachnospiraceae bacterium]
KSEEYENKTREFIKPILDEYGYSLEDIEYVREGADMYLRVYIDKPGGITINDCVDVSRRMNEILDREDYIDEAYTFEVSSPDLSRPLRKPGDFDRNMDMPVEVGFYKAIDKKKQMIGTLRGYDEDSLTIETDEGTVTLSRKDIAVVKPYITVD